MPKQCFFSTSASTVPNKSDTIWSLWAKIVIRLVQLTGKTQYLPDCVDSRYWLIWKALLLFGFFAIQWNAGGGWTPNTPGTVIEWLQADKIVGISNGGAIATWPHTVGVDATATGLNQPTFLTNQQNGLPLVSFDGNNNIMAALGFAGQLQPFTIAVAYKYLGPGTLDWILASGDVSPTSIGNNAGNLILLSGNNVTLQPTDNNFDILFLVVNGGLSFQGFNGGLFTSISNPGNRNFTGLFLGAAGGQIHPAQVKIGEFILWSGDGTSFYNKAYTYLNQRWA